jgi:hypothetical protein
MPIIRNISNTNNYQIAFILLITDYIEEMASYSIPMLCIVQAFAAASHEMQVKLTTMSGSCNAFYLHCS